MFQSKGIMTLFMMFIMTMCCFAAQFTRDPTGKCGDDCTWTLDESSGKLTISGTGTLKNKDDDAWKDYKSTIRSVVINNGITCIEQAAFIGLSEVTSVTIPDSVVYIGEDAFGGCNKIEFTPYDNGLYLGNSANKYHALVKVKDYKNNSLILNDNIKTVADDAIEFLEDFPFNKYGSGNYIGTPSNPYFYFRYGNDTISTSCVIHDNCKIVGYYSFKGTDFESITIGKSVIAILGFAFRDVNRITSMIIPNSVVSIGERAFIGCYRLKSLTLGRSVSVVAEGALSHLSSLSNVCYLGSTVFKTDIFEDCYELSSVSVTENYKGSTFCGRPVITKDQSCVAPPSPSSSAKSSGSWNFKPSIFITAIIAFMVAML